MMNKDKNCEGVKNASFLIFRIAFGAFMLLSGLPKLIAVFQGQNPLAWAGLPLIIGILVAIVEVVGGAFLILGVLQFWSAGALAVVMLGATIINPIIGFDGSNVIGSIKGIFLHLLYIAAAMVIGFTKSKFMALDKFCKKA